MNILGIVPARGGSKGIPDKNLRQLAGKPLLAYTLEAVSGSGVIDRLVLSTDSADIAQLGKDLGYEVPFMRPAELAQDETPMLPVLQHAVTELETAGWHAEIIVLLQPTSPLRRPGHIAQAIEILRSGDWDSVVSVVEIPDIYSPQKALRIEGDGLQFWTPDVQAITRRQQVQPAYAREGTVYACWRETLMDNGNLYGERIAPLVVGLADALSLDTMDDWQRAEALLGGKNE